jgi:hypothetical protein
MNLLPCLFCSVLLLFLGIDCVISAGLYYGSVPINSLHYYLCQILWQKGGVQTWFNYDLLYSGGIICIFSGYDIV